jgi:hypothetical protein
MGCNLIVSLVKIGYLPNKGLVLCSQSCSSPNIISNPVASELLPKGRTRQCRFPTINRGRETALPCPLYHSGATGIDITLLQESMIDF